MSKRTTRQLLIAFALILTLFIVLGLVPLGQFAYADQYLDEEEHLDLGLHWQTKIYSKSFSSDYYAGCEDYDNYSSAAPSITFFTPGLGSPASVWSNMGGGLQYNPNSIIAGICNRLNDNVDLYFARCESATNLTSFNLYKLELKNYDYSNKNTACIDDVSKHILVLFESSIKEDGNQIVYEQFEYVVDSISLQYKNLSGVLPRINLVGHSRGGLTNIQYATEHPYNVASVFSLGTPYNGSVLGQIDLIMANLLPYKDAVLDENGQIVGFDFVNEGARDIMNPNLSVDMRNKWNEAYTSDVNMNVVSLGSIADMSFIRGFVSDAKNDSNYAEKAAKVEGILNFIANFAEDNPQDTKYFFDKVDGLLRLMQAFGKDPCRYGAKLAEMFNADPSIVKGIEELTIDEICDVLSLINVINDQIVIMDDLFIDMNSQLGWGFDDGKEYNGFKRYVKIFSADDITNNRATSQPAVIHNLETMNEDYVYMISKSLVLGNGKPINELSDESSGNTVENGSAFYFTPQSSGTREFIMNGADISLYKYNQYEGVDCVKRENNKLSYCFKSNENYLIVIDNMDKTQVRFSFKIADEFICDTGNVFNLGFDDSAICYLQVEESGYYNVSSTSYNVSVELNGRTVDSAMYLKQGEKNIIVVRNTSSYGITASISITPADAVGLETNFENITSNKVVCFTNPYSIQISFRLTIKWNDVNEKKEASIYNLNNVRKGSTVISKGQRITSFTLSPNEKCFIVFSDCDGTVTANIEIKAKQYIWVIKDGDKELQTRELERGKEYDVRFYLMSGNTIVEQVTGFQVPESENFSYYNNILDIKSNADLGYDILLTPITAPEEQLIIDIVLNREEIDYKITLYEADDNGGIRYFYAHYNNEYPTVTKPTWTGRAFLGYYLLEDENTLVYDSNANCCFDKYLYEEDIELIAHWERLFNIITFYSDGDISFTDSIEAMNNEPIPNVDCFAPTLTGHEFVGYYTEPDGKGTQYYRMEKKYHSQDSAIYEYDCYYEGVTRVTTKTSTGREVPIIWNENRDATLYAYFKKLTCKYDVECYEYEADLIGTIQVSLIHGETCTVEAPKIEGYTFKYFAMPFGNDNPNQTVEFTAFLRRARTVEFNIVPELYVMAIYEKDNCVAQGTLITLADGTQVPVESLKGDEMLLVWNMITGKLDAARIMFVDSDKAATYKVINLSFSDGTTVKVISEHGFWDYNLNKFVYLRSDASKYIGHWFNKGDTRVQLTSVEVRDEYTTAYSPVTYGHLCYYVNGMLSMPGGIDGLFNIFEVDPVTMTVNLDAMAQDIATYGLFTYDEFVELVPVTEDVFNAFNGQYLKVAIGKGMITVEQLNNLVNRYAEFFVEAE